MTCHSLRAGDRGSGRPLLLLGAIALVLLSSTPALANLTFPTQKKDGSPDRRRGAGSRPAETCLVGQTRDQLARSPFALVPESNIVTTSSAHPEFFWYMPPTTAASVTFELSKATGDQSVVYAADFPVNGTEGIARLALPRGVGGRSPWKPTSPTAGPSACAVQPRRSP